MKYSQLLADPKAQEAFRAAFVDDMDSPLGDFDIHYSVATDSKFRAEFLDIAIEKEIETRKKVKEYNAKMAELDEKMQPYRERQAKINAVRPTVQNYVQGNIKDQFNKPGIENGMISVLSEMIVDKFGDSIHLGDDGSVIPGEPVPDTSGMSELDQILTRARITRLSAYQTVDDMFFHCFTNTPFPALMK